MKVHELQDALKKISAAGDGYKEVKVWLPGSTISLSGEAFFNERHQAVLIEGNVDPGSALEAR